MDLNPQVTGNVGLYYCCYQLSLRGWNVMPTSRNARGIDIIAYKEGIKDFRALQVKTLGKGTNVSVKSLKKIEGDFWIIVNITPNPTSVFVLRPSEVKNLSTKYGDQFWLKAQAYSQSRFKDAWNRIEN